MNGRISYKTYSIVSFARPIPEFALHHLIHTNCIVIDMENGVKLNKLPWIDSFKHIQFIKYTIQSVYRINMGLYAYVSEFIPSIWQQFKIILAI